MSAENRILIMQYPLTCFLIENDPDDQEIFGMALQEAAPDASCVCANSGVQALELLEQDLSFVPSLVIMDMNMPLMDGKECLQALKAMERLREVPVYMYSTTADPLSVSEVKGLGAVDFFEKPASFHELTALLRQLVEAHKNLSSAKE